MLNCIYFVVAEYPVFSLYLLPLAILISLTACNYIDVPFLPSDRLLFFVPGIFLNVSFCQVSLLQALQFINSFQSVCLVGKEKALFLAILVSMKMPKGLWLQQKCSSQITVRIALFSH